MTPNHRGDRRRRRIGLLGGSFNPAHAGHRHVAERVRRALRLDEIWLMVSPGNPLKPRAGMAPLADRLASARAIADGRRIIATDIEARLGTRYTQDTLRELHRRFPRSRFVFVIGADNLVQLPRWQGWTRLAARTPIAVLPRPRWTRKALASKAAKRLARHRRRPGALLAGPPPAHAPSSHAPWAFVPAAEHPASATAIRAAAARAPSRAPAPRPAAMRRAMPSPRMQAAAPAAR
ncbi:nicotinate-nucleotide adenylyltransferase [Falsiroseomonas bella]|uniref:nicotinate-nucleotide adenylyltransferase n=1 Tax=Falsiroseomonas bella TaxID=2184016 RepID=UPI001E607F06|nr:nicotinate-nucleotide adenylyltransferase [Falsiroseomonas bella]